jgi:hypothetical protein
MNGDKNEGTFMGFPFPFRGRRIPPYILNCNELPIIIM